MIAPPWGITRCAGGIFDVDDDDDVGDVENVHNVMPMIGGTAAVAVDRVTRRVVGAKAARRAAAETKHMMVLEVILTELPFFTIFVCVFFWIVWLRSTN